MGAVYGRGAYGNRLYSAGVITDQRGILSPFVTLFAQPMDVVTPPGNLVGGMRPTIVLGASLTGDWVLRGGSIAPSVVLAATLTSGPLWGPSQLCEAEWVEAELCDG